MSIRRPLLRRSAAEGGYTLVEFAVAMSVFAIFMAMAGPFMFSQLQGALETQERVDLQQNARSALRTMVRELRQADQLLQAADNPSGKTELSFAVDWDVDGSISGCGATPPDVPETITYYAQSRVLYSGCKKGDAVPLADNVDEVEFTMFGSSLALDANGDGVVDETELGGPPWTTTELANVTRVKVSITMSDDDAGGDADEQTYEAQAYLRNRAVS